ncbi:hypothetical protein GCM10009775_34770 [Microbacterium aoyamense]|uniref:DUF5689 domain-containing protein n=1 Tax=Microbacterium aoyamense TaxID=344166 RepID=A0ABN2Q0V4_9MICO|nr:hypothetical protein [Microbacterium aoyamense]
MKRGAVIGIAAGAVALVAAAGVGWWLLSRPPTAEQTAETYLRALSEGDAETIRGLLNEPPGGFDEIAAAFEGADSYIETYEFDDVGDDGGVRADVVIDGEPGVVFFILAADESGRFVLNGDYLALLDTATTIGDSVRVGDVLMPAGRVSLLPAVYTVAAAPSDLVEGSTTVALTNAEPATAAVEASVSPDALATIEEQLGGYIADCTKTATAVPEHCGIRVPWAADLATLDSLAFRVDSAPVLALAPDARAFAATGGVLVATATGTKRDGSAGTFTYRADDWALRGTVTFTGDTMTLSVG